MARTNPGRQARNRARKAVAAAATAARAEMQRLDSDNSIVNPLFQGHNDDASDAFGASDNDEDDHDEQPESMAGVAPSGSAAARRSRGGSCQRRTTRGRHGTAQAGAAQGRSLSLAPSAGSRLVRQLLSIKMQFGLMLCPVCTIKCYKQRSSWITRVKTHEHWSWAQAERQAGQSHHTIRPWSVGPNAGRNVNK
ncbi:uncharacterized protein PAN0_017d5421 [Moesziomyces antarcticus]|uniref:Uncharacterized protein n=2 Tax=Pseudozyma antarctica TaxID=84753 RepID=A0A5C3FUU7_PSEA2|nr:uncharacterized protein PAN0_017d5421 [Moesziomyces antarcticus]GAK67195.1 hypothetical protein PAN0_017d5421 [Moesziomyces antarcticus]SPO48198.1 uncharacterized protein PSANT_05886 [Moesziomyces antarcticus]